VPDNEEKIEELELTTEVLSYETALEIAQKKNITLATAIDDVILWIQRSRGDQLRLMISLFGLPWFRYMKEPYRPVPDMPAHAVQEISKAQPWDVGETGLAISPEPEEIHKILKTWLAVVYQDGIDKHGSSQLPGEYNVYRGGGVMLHLGYIWWDKEGADVNDILDVMVDTRMTTVLWNYLKRIKQHSENIVTPPWSKIHEIYDEYEFSKQRAEATERLLFPDEEKRENKKSIKKRLQIDLAEGKTGQVFFDPETNTMSWMLKDREKFNEVLLDMGLNDSQHEVSPYYELWYSIGNAIKEDEMNEALTLVEELFTQLKEQQK